MINGQVRAGRFALLLILGSITGAHAAEDPPAFIFRFSPPDGTTVVQSYRLTRSRAVEGQAPVQDEFMSKSRGTFSRLDDVYEYRPQVVEMAMRRNGKPVDDPILSTLAAAEVTYVIEGNAQVREIRGFESLASVVKSRLPARAAAAIAPLLSEPALVAKEKAEWNGRYAEFADGEFKIGDVFDANATHPLPNGETVEYTVRTSFTGWESCGASRCVRIDQLYESDASALAVMANSFAVSIVPSASAAMSVAHLGESVRITGRLTRLIDPQTMLIYSERLERTLTMPVDVPRRGRVAMTQREERHYEYEYTYQ